MKAAPDRLCVSIDFGVRRVVAEAHGEIDSLTSPWLGRLLNAVVDGGHGVVVLDLADVDFMDGSGLHVISDLASRVGAMAGSLTLRSPSPVAERLLRLTHLHQLVRADAAADADAAIADAADAADADAAIADAAVNARSELGAEQQSGDGSSGGANEGASPLAHPTPLLGLPVATDVLDAAMRLVVALARTTVGGADGVSVSLRRHGRLTTVAASDETISQMDRDQYATAQGPCVSAASEGRWFHVDSLDEETRWPEFIPRAIAGGIRSILSTPLMLDTQPLGALNIYSNAEGAFGPEEQSLAALFATQASGILADAGTEAAAADSWVRFHEALDARQVIAHAQGVLMERGGMSADAAYVVLRNEAQLAETTLREHAALIVDSATVGRPEQKEGPRG